MIRIGNLKPRVTGDTAPFKFQLTDASGTPTLIAGFGFTLTVDPNEEPASTATNLFTITGVIDDEDTGLFNFPPTQPEANLLVPLANDRAYWVWLKVTDATGKTETAKGRLPVAAGSGG
jgi:hypothetical protein